LFSSTVSFIWMLFTQLYRHNLKLKAKLENRVELYHM